MAEDRFSDNDLLVLRPRARHCVPFWNSRFFFGIEFFNTHNQQVGASIFAPGLVCRRDQRAPSKSIQVRPKRIRRDLGVRSS